MNNKPIRIWVVDDNPREIGLFRDALHRSGLNFDLIAIGDGAEAVALMRPEETSGRTAIPDLVILDSSVSEADGLEVLEAMRQSDVPVVMTSCLISPPDRARKVEEFFQLIAAVQEAVPAASGKRSAVRSRRRPIPDRAGRQS